MLAAEHRRAVSRDELAQELWGDEAPPAWPKALSAIVSKIRGVLASVGLPASTLENAFGCYQLLLPGDAFVDIEAAADALHQAETSLRDGDAVAAYAAAHVAAYILRRPFLPGEDTPWVASRRAELTALDARASAVAARVCREVGEYEAAIQHAEHAVTTDPFREAGWQELMLSHLGTGSPAAALRVYERCSKVLAEELGAKPSPSTEAVFREALAQS